MKKKVEYVSSVSSFDRHLYETKDDFRSHVESCLGKQLGEYIAKNKNTLPIRFTEVESNHPCTDYMALRVDMVIVDRSLKKIVELMVNDGDISEIMYEIQLYRSKRG